MGDTDLKRRLDINERYSVADLNEWIRTFVNIRSGDKVLDVCCGTGKQLLMYSDMAGESGDIYGIDSNEENLKAIIPLVPEKRSITLYLGKMEEMLSDYALGTMKTSFHSVICTYGLYYSEHPLRTLSDMKELLRPGGNLYIIGPARGNNKEFFDLVGSLKQIPDPILFSSNGFMDEIVIPSCINLFENFDTHEFRNEVIYPDVEGLLSYWRSTTYYDPEIAPKLELLLLDHFRNNETYKIKKEALGIKCWD